MVNQLIKVVFSVMGSFILASLYPGYPTIEATKACSIKEANHCIELNSVCAPSFDPKSPNLAATPLCLTKRNNICKQCRSAIKGYDMGYWDRLFYYGPFWLKYFQPESSAG